MRKLTTEKDTSMMIRRLRMREVDQLSKPWQPAKSSQQQIMSLKIEGDGASRANSQALQIHKEVINLEEVTNIDVFPGNRLSQTLVIVSELYISHS